MFTRNDRSVGDGVWTAGDVRYTSMDVLLTRLVGQPFVVHQPSAPDGPHAKVWLISADLWAVDNGTDAGPVYPSFTEIADMLDSCELDTTLEPPS